MRFRDLPLGAAWRHEVARDGFESVFVRSDGSGYRFDGHTAAVEDGEIWAVRYTIMRVGQSVEAPAAYVRALDLRVERLEQTYMRLDDDGDRQRYQYRSPAFGFEAQLVYDASGLVLDYPGVASRVQ
jgi:uncharacterized protein